MALNYIWILFFLSAFIFVPFVSSLLFPVLLIPHESALLPITDSLSPSLKSERSFQAISLAYLAISAANRIGTTHDASVKVYRAERYEGLVSRMQ